ncbi:MAG: hypothetical protein V7K21_09950 [Nostoc sp.]
MPQSFTGKTGNDFRGFVPHYKLMGNGRTRPSPLAMKEIEKLLYQIEEPGETLLAKYFQK